MLLVGILSDSHGRCDMVRAAVALFDRLGVEHLIHCGDVGGTAVFETFIDRPLTFVWGNTDLPEPGLVRFLETVGLAPPSNVPTRLTLGGKTFDVFHGHERGFGPALAAPATDYLLHGHSHVTCDRRVGATRIINPGALHRAATKTVALLDTARDELTFHPIAIV